MDMHPKRSLSHLLLVHEIAFLFLVAVTGLLSGLSAYFWQKTSSESIRINNSIYLGEQIRGELYRQIQEVVRARLLEDDQALVVYADYTKRIDTHFNQLRQTSVNREEDTVIQGLQQVYSEIQFDMNIIFDDPYHADSALRMKILEPLIAEQMFNRFEERYEELKSVYGEAHRDLEQTIALWTQYAPVLIPFLFLVAVIIVIYTSQIIRNGFVKPVATIMDGAAEISRGELAHRIPEQGVNEVSEIAGSINKMAGELKISRDALVEHERQAALGALVPVVAHNIRNPLASIRATAQVLEDIESPAELAESKRAIIDTTDRLGRWVNALVSYLHPLKPSLRSIQVSQLIDAALAPLRTRIDEKQIRIERNGWELSEKVRVDPDLMEQALYGLLANAIDASEQRGTLSITIDNDEEQITICIEDNGPGLPFEPKPGNLEPGPSTKRFGTGLGIPIAFKICQSHGWELAFEAIEDAGTLVSIIVPGNTGKAANNGN